MPIYKIDALEGFGIYIGYPAKRGKNALLKKDVDTVQVAVPEFKGNQIIGEGLVNAVAYAFDEKNILMLHKRDELCFTAGKMELTDIIPEATEFQKACLEMINASPEDESHAKLQQKLNELAKSHRLAEAVQKFNDVAPMAKEAKKLRSKTPLSDGQFAPHGRTPMPGILPAAICRAARRETLEESGLDLNNIEGFYLDRSISQEIIRENVKGLEKASLEEQDRNFRTVNYAFPLPNLSDKVSFFKDGGEGIPTLCSWDNIRKNRKIDDPLKGWFTIRSDNGIKLRSGADISLLTVLSTPEILSEYIGFAKDNLKLASPEDAKKGPGSETLRAPSPTIAFHKKPLPNLEAQEQQNITEVHSQFEPSAS